MNIIFLIKCPDHTGLLANISSFFYNSGFNILQCRQYTDTLNEKYFMRIQLDGDGLKSSRRELEAEFDVSFAASTGWLSPTLNGDGSATFTVDDWSYLSVNTSGHLQGVFTPGETISILGQVRIDAVATDATDCIFGVKFVDSGNASISYFLKHFS